jgi:hypothetical protein
MARTPDVVIERTETVEPTPGARVSWSGIFGGVVVGIGALLLMTALGVAVGITAIDVEQPDASALGTGAAIWTGVSLLLALFLGGWSAARMSMLWDRTAALFQGTLVWALSMLLILWLAASGVGLIAGQTFSLLGTTASTVGAATGGADLGGLLQGDADRVLATLDDPKTAQTIASLTGMEAGEVTRRLDDLRSRIEAARDNPQQVAAELRTATSDFADRAQARIASAATQAQPAATRTAWSTFGALLLGLLAGMAGAAVGRHNAARRTRVPTSTTPARPTAQA